MSTPGKRRPSRFLFVAIVVELAIIAVLASAVVRPRSGIDVADEQNRQATSMLLATDTLRQSSDYLSRFARSLPVTDTAC